MTDDTKIDPLAPPTDAELEEEMRTKDAHEAAAAKEQKAPEIEPEKPKAKTARAKKPKPETVPPEDEAATEGAEEREGHPLTITDEATYHEVAARYGLPIGGHELGAFNGVTDSRYELTEGQIIYLPWPVPEPTA